MKKMSFALSALLSMLALASSAQAAKPDDDLPETLRANYVGPVLGPADDTVYARGRLGLIRTSYGRASLYVAWRVMQLPAGALAAEKHDRLDDWVYGKAAPAPATDEIQTWLAARGALQPRAPAVAPDYYRTRKVKVDGGLEFETAEGQCGAGAFVLATRTLRELVADASLKPADRLLWIAGQDAVFARCSWLPGNTAPPALPAPLPASVTGKLYALHAYQRATAMFYGDEYTAARQAFEAIAAVPDHPMRGWATVGALRSVVRAAARDEEWTAAVDDAWGRRKLRGAEFSAAVAEAAGRRRVRTEAAMKEITSRAEVALADTTLAPVHGAIHYTYRRALAQLAPQLPLREAMQALDRAQDNPYASGMLDLFQQLYPRVVPGRAHDLRAAHLRRHAWFDFIAAVQACSNTPGDVDAAACDAEHGHALARWQQTRHNAWLLAALMTARQPSAADLPAAEAARAVPAERPEWASLQFYAARVLRAQGRSADARAAVEALAVSPLVHKRDRPLLEAEQPGVTRLAVAAPVITEAQVRAEYDRQVSQGPYEYRVRHLLVQTQEQAQAALDRIRGGEPFEAVAAAVSIDAGSRAKGGDLGWSVPDRYVAPFAAAIKRLVPRGRADSPVQTPFGWHVLEVTDVRPHTVLPYEQVKGRILEALQRQAGQRQR